MVSKSQEDAGRITPTAGWLLRCICLSKLSIVVLPDVWAYPSTLFVALAVSPLHLNNSKGGGADRTQPTPRKMTVPQGIAHTVSVGVALLSTRHTLLAGVLPLFVPESGLSDSGVRATICR